MDDVKSLAHTKWNCKYHVVFAPKYRRKVFYEEKRLEIRAILRELCRWKLYLLCFELVYFFYHFIHLSFDNFIDGALCNPCFAV